MINNNLLAKCKPDTTTLLFGSEEWNENLLLHRSYYPHPIVADKKRNILGAIIIRTLFNRERDPLLVTLGRLALLARLYGIF